MKAKKYEEQNLSNDFTKNDAKLSRMRDGIIKLL